MPPERTDAVNMAAADAINIADLGDQHRCAADGVAYQIKTRRAVPYLMEAVSIVAQQLRPELVM